jgi:flagellar biosynthesis protein FliP
MTKVMRKKNIYNKLMIRLDEKDRRDDMLVFFQYFIVLFVLCLVSNIVIIFFSFIKIYTYFFHSVFNYGDLSQ